MAQCFGRHANPKQKGSAETKHCSKNLREEVSEQHPARHSLLGSAGRCCFALSRIRRFRFAVFLEAAWRYCAVNTILAHRPPQCNDGPAGRRNRVGLVSAGIRGMSDGSVRGQNHAGSNRLGPDRGACGALRAGALGIDRASWPNTPFIRRAEVAEPQNRHDCHAPAKLPGRSPAALRPTAEPSWPAGSADDTVKDRPPDTFHWVEDAREPGARMVRPANGPPHNGAVFVAQASFNAG